MEKLDYLRGLLQKLNGAVIAYSGGVDSTFLAVVAREVLGERALAVTAVSPTYSRRELDEAKEMAARFGLRHLVVETDEFGDPRFLANPPDRCYYCKRALFQRLRRIADEEGLEAVLDGANLDDLADHRPGHRAARELGVRSPLQEAGLSKEEIRRYSRELGLPTWDKPAYACLASRLPYGTRITAEALARIEGAEAYLRSLGLREVRVRDHHPVARIEIGRGEMEAAWRHRAEIAAHLHALGYPYVTLDLDGFRSGSMNAVLTAKEVTSS
ncbi:MAG: ATP-dependent sacrificial sulfur transferase LarE [Firmicutes bacterium]|nr:ATP-dependent sacrificial sulfur transferase LarE [Bacillota bacterium]